MDKSAEQSDSNKCGLSIGERTWAASRQGIPCVPIEPMGDRILPSVLMPSTARELPRLDDHWPPHNRGIGGDWPPEARVNTETGCGRFPMAAVIAGLPEQRSWQWTYDGREQKLSAAAALGAAATSIVKRHAKNGGVLAIPNWLREADQQLLLDTARRSGASLKLLWQPIAAALSFLESHRCSEGEKAFLHVHCGWNVITLTQLSLVWRHHEGQSYLVPARKRPSLERDTTSGFGWAQLHSELQNGQHTHRIDEHWCDLFVSRDFAKRESVFDVFGPDQIEDLRGPENGCIPGQPWTIRQQLIADARRWLVSEISKMKELKAIAVTGDGACCLTGILNLPQANGEVASTIIDPDRNVKERRFLNAVKETSCELDNVVIADGVVGEQFLAQGAALFGYRSDRGLPTYRDTLPQMELMLQVAGELQWINLLDENSSDVEGGQVWTRPQPITGLSVKRGEESITIPVYHEEYETVRDLVFEFPHPVSHKLPAELFVSAAPASGYAQVELRFTKKELKGRSAILADWRRMTDTGMGREEYLNSQPRAFPETMPRQSSPMCWRKAIRELEELADWVAGGCDTDRWRWDQIKDLLKFKDSDYSPQDATAVDSEGLGPNSSHRAHQAGTALCDRVMSDEYVPNAAAIRILGYISYDAPKLEKWLLDNLGNRELETGCVLHSCGHCLRDPQNIKTFFEQCPQIFQGNMGGGPINALKSISQVLLYRGNATKMLENSTCENLLDHARKQFYSDMVNKDGKTFAFRWSAVVIVFLLRRRMYDPSFFDPSSESAIRAKEMFETAIDRFEKGKLHPISGAADTPKALQQLIDYIDKKGNGLIQMASED